MKRISDSHQAMWGHDHERIQTWWDCTLAEDHNSFEMHRMVVRTDQLFHIAMATNYQIYTRYSEAEVHGWVKTLLLLLKQYHAHYYHFYEKGMTRAMVGHQGLHLSDALYSEWVFTQLYELSCFCFTYMFEVPWCFGLLFCSIRHRFLILLNKS